MEHRCVPSKMSVRLRGVRRFTTNPRQQGELEAPLSSLFAHATSLAEMDPHIGSSEPWRELKRILPLLAEAQAMLLQTETARCRRLAERRGGRACTVRFRCFDLSAVDPPSMQLGSQQTEEQLLAVLLRLSSAQRKWQATTSVRALHLSPLLSPLLWAGKGRRRSAHLPYGRGETSSPPQGIGVAWGGVRRS